MTPERVTIELLLFVTPNYDLTSSQHQEYEIVHEDRLQARLENVGTKYCFEVKYCEHDQDPNI